MLNNDLTIVFGEGFVAVAAIARRLTQDTRWTEGIGNHACIPEKTIRRWLGVQTYGQSCIICCRRSRQLSAPKRTHGAQPECVIADLRGTGCKRGNCGTFPTFHFCHFADAASFRTCGDTFAAASPKSQKRTCSAGFDRSIRTAVSLDGVRKGDIQT